MTKHTPDNQMKARYRKMRLNGKQISVHRYIAEQNIGRPLEPDEVVHHINGNKLDNRPENLQVMTVGEHSRLTFKELPAETRYRMVRNNLGKVATEEAREHMAESQRKAWAEGRRKIASVVPMLTAIGRRLRRRIK